MKQSQRVGLWVIGACLAVGFGFWWWLVWMPKAEAAERVVEVQKRVLARLNDPDSAKFRGVKYFPQTGAGCGDLNARNRMGGYVGFTSFVALKNGEVTFHPGKEDQSRPTGERLAALRGELEFLQFMAASCPDDEPPPALPPPKN